MSPVAYLKYDNANSLPKHNVFPNSFSEEKEGLRIHCILRGNSLQLRRGLDQIQLAYDPCRLKLTASVFNPLKPV